MSEDLPILLFAGPHVPADFEVEWVRVEPGETLRGGMHYVDPVDRTLWRRRETDTPERTTCL